jgi:hypothetical protein
VTEWGDNVGNYQAMNINSIKPIRKNCQVAMNMIQQNMRNIYKYRVMSQNHKAKIFLKEFV